MESQNDANCSRLLEELEFAAKTRTYFSDRTNAPQEIWGVDINVLEECDLSAFMQSLNLNLVSRKEK